MEIPIQQIEDNNTDVTINPDDGLLRIQQIKSRIRDSRGDLCSAPVYDMWSEE